MKILTSWPQFIVVDVVSSSCCVKLILLQSGGCPVEMEHGVLIGGMQSRKRKPLQSFSTSYFRRFGELHKIHLSVWGTEWTE